MKSSGKNQIAPDLKPIWTKKNTLHNAIYSLMLKSFYSKLCKNFLFLVFNRIVHACFQVTRNIHIRCTTYEKTNPPLNNLMQHNNNNTKTR